MRIKLQERIRRPWSAFILTSIVIVASLLLIRSLKGPPTPKDETSSLAPYTSSPEAGMERFNLIETVDGAKKWMLTSNQAQFLKEEIQLEGFNLVFFEEEKPILTLSAKKGVLDQKVRDIKTASNVMVVDGSGKMKLVTSNLWWRANPGVLTTEDKLTLTKDGVRIMGKGLIMDPKMERVEIKKKARIRIEE
ncbi:TPA: LPS export ABC transporter periplasmic protein LptC [bacterium]|nr:LPS export ABC transporter periplasmic protein LptC [bacterium]